MDNKEDIQANIRSILMESDKAINIFDMVRSYSDKFGEKREPLAMIYFLKGMDGVHRIPLTYTYTME